MLKPLRNRENIELNVVYEISKVLGSSLDLHKTIRAVLGILSSHLDIRRCMISLVQEGGELHVVGATGMSPEEMERGRFQKGEGITGKIMQSGLPVVIPDITEEPMYLNRTGSRDIAAGQTIAFVGVPIKVGRETIGVISLDRDTQGRQANFRRDVGLLKMVANLVGQTAKLHSLVFAERNELLQEKHRLQKELQIRYQLDNVVGKSKIMQEIFAEVHQVAPGRSTVLIRGESGTGKEMIARSIHYLSPRKDGPFVKLNCAALSETLLESELFGHEKGAFTGATQDRKGRFELAHGGTLFLDEIGDVSPAFQTKLLRVLQEREFERVGGNKSIRVDVRLIAATNKNLEDAVAAGEFRADLYYRINVVTVTLPPLRERREDIPLLVDHFVAKFNRENERKVVILPQAVKVMTNCTWPGNIRELENCVERMCTMARSDLIRDLDVPCQQNKCFSMLLQPPHLQEHNKTLWNIPVINAPLDADGDDGLGGSDEDQGAGFASQRDRLIWAMNQCGWVQAKAARLLNLSARQMGYALKKYNIPIKRF